MGKIVSESERIALRFKSVFTKINIGYLLEKFSREHFTPLVPYPNNETLNDSLVRFRGAILRKGNIIIDVDTSLNSCGIQAGSDIELLENIATFFKIIEEMVNNYNDVLWFYEFHVRIEMSGSAIKELSNLNGKAIAKLKGLGNTLSKELNPSGVTLWSSSSADSPDFVELKMEQSVLNEKNTVYKVIYRNEDYEVFNANIKVFIANIKEL